MKKLTILFLFILGFSVSAFSQIASSAAETNPLKIGDTVPDASLTDAKGKTKSLLAIAEDKPTVLIFYRGGWCPYCNLHLGELAGIEQDVLDLGYQIVAVSPDSFENIMKTEKKAEANYQIYSDADASLIAQMGIAFESRKKVLPVPSVFVLDQKGVIQFEYVNPDYSKRLSGKTLLAVLGSM